ncbi:MAG: hypothetical protein KBF12_04845 [Sebaldella sp.]|nr:hypothetical protein [Sebaldella sp.]
MKRILLIILLITAILSCKDSKELTIPDKDLSYKDGVVLYKGKAYTGKINVKKLNDKEQFEEGFVTLKNGHLDGITELKNEKVGTYFKFNVKDKRLEGEYILEHPKIGDLTMSFQDGLLKRLNGKFPNDIRQEFIIDKNGNVNGILKQDGQELEFKNGLADEEGLKVKMYIDKETGQKLITEVYEDNKVVSKGEAVILFSIKDFEEVLLPEIVVK